MRPPRRLILLLCLSAACGDPDGAPDGGLDGGALDAAADGAAGCPREAAPADRPRRVIV